MKRGRTTRGTLTVLAAIVLSACSTSQGPATALNQKPRAERPTYVIGEKWMRNDGVYTLIRIESDRYIFSAGPGQEIHLTKDLMVARVQQGQLFWEFDPPPVLTWPLEVGKWGTSWVLVRTLSFPEGLRAELTWSVEGYQDIHVLSAGTFKVFRISLSVRPERLYLHTPGVAQLWYAPEVRRFVKMEGTGMTSFLDFELVAARPAVTVRPLRLPDRVQQAFEEYRSSPRFYNFKAFSFDEMSGSSGRAWGITRRNARSTEQCGNAASNPESAKYMRLEIRSYGACPLRKLPQYPKPILRGRRKRRASLRAPPTSIRFQRLGKRTRQVHACHPTKYASTYPGRFLREPLRPDFASWGSTPTMALCPAMPTRWRILGHGQCALTRYAGNGEGCLMAKWTVS